MMISETTERDTQAARTRQTIDDILKEMPDWFDPDPGKWTAFRRLHAMIEPLCNSGLDDDEALYDALAEKYGPVSRY